MRIVDAGRPSRRLVLAAAGLVPALAFAGTGGAAAAVGGDRGPGMSVRRLAWAGVRLEVGDVALFVDARAPDPAGGAPGPPLEPGAGRTFALATHHHPDHCDPVALRPVLGEHGYLVVQEDVARLFDTRPVNVQTVKLYEPVFLSRGGGEFVAWCVPASDGLGSPQVSWIVDGGGKRIIHCGDTAWHGGWWNIARAYGPFDAAFLPINGYRQSAGIFEHVEQPMGMTPEQAALAAQILGARLVIPIHFGSSGNPNYVEEPDALARFVRAATARHLTPRALTPGETLRLTA